MLLLSMQQKLSRIILGLLVLFVFNCTRAEVTDTVTLSGKVIITSGALPATDIKLNPYGDGAETFNGYLNSDGSFQFRVPVKELELYEVRYGGYAKSVLFTKAERNIGFEIYTKDGKVDQMFITNSTENQAHEIFRQFNNSLRDSLKGFRTGCAPNVENCVKRWAQVMLNHNGHMQEIIEQFPATFTAKVLAPMSKIPVVNNQMSPVELMQYHFFDAANFTDLRLFSTADVGVKFITYLDNIADTSSRGRLDFITEMFLKAMGNAEARKKVGTALYNIFTKTNREAYLSSMCKWTAAQSWADEQMPVISARLKLAGQVMPGSKAPEVSGVDLDGKSRSLADMVKTNKLTLLIFWESDCAHCRQSMPEFLRLYEQYHAQGLNVVAASLDHNSADWKKFIAENKMSWININLPATTSAYSDYFIQATPAMALIDKQGIIIHRYMEVKELDGYIRDELK